MLFKRNKFFPFEDMRGVKSAILTPEQFKFLVSRLYWGLEREIEDGGYITVCKEGEVARVNECYPLPDEFKTNSYVDIPKAEKSDWYKNLLSELTTKQQKIGFYYHTHPSILDYGKELHEEGCTARRTRTYRSDKIMEKYMKPEEKKLSVATKRLGDIIIEMLKGNKINIYGYTPATKFYYEDHPFHGLTPRETHSLKIIVLETDLRFDSFLP